MIPVHKTLESAGADWELQEDITFWPFQQVLVRTGVFLPKDIPVNHFVLTAPRSSLFGKFNLIQTNSIGIIDADFKNEILTPLLNLSTVPVTVKKGTGMGQLICTNYVNIFPIKDAKRIGGFGSSDKKDLH